MSIKRSRICSIDLIKGSHPSRQLSRNLQISKCVSKSRGRKVHRMRTAIIGMVP
ncbi:hypothetical protein Gohar_004788 [Gossypium harknessii]|uniref:Uncharacterized protein n=1 Tax=Gossypium harknessii TaxID=34285 RepID=A0A7J9H6B1_9ROSI|nr:hypothetical protein [Gossypium harknessii]